MNLKRRILTLASIMLLSITMTAGIAVAQEEEGPQTTSGEITITVECGTSNAGTGSVTLNASNPDTPVAFSDFDPSADPQTVSSSTANKAFRVDLDLSSCPGADWSVTASISDFTTGTTDPDIIPAAKFQLPIGEPESSAAWTTDGNTPAANVTGPSGIVSFGADGSANQTLASPAGDASGIMYMEFTGQLIGLDDTIPAGTYTAQFTVTFNPSQP